MGGFVFRQLDLGTKVNFVQNTRETRVRNLGAARMGDVTQLQKFFT